MHSKRFQSVHYWSSLIILKYEKLSDVLFLAHYKDDCNNNDY